MGSESKGNSKNGSGSNVDTATPLRRSSRFNPPTTTDNNSNKTTTPTRKSSRVEKTTTTTTTTPPASTSKAATITTTNNNSGLRRSERLEKPSPSPPLRRSERGKKQSSLHSSSRKQLSPLDGNGKKKKSVNQLTKQMNTASKTRRNSDYKKIFKRPAKDVPPGRSKRVKLFKECTENRNGDRSNDDCSLMDREESSEKMSNAPDSGDGTSGNDSQENKSPELAHSSTKDRNSEEDPDVGNGAEVVNTTSNELIPDLDVGSETGSKDAPATVPTKDTVTNPADSATSPHGSKENATLDDCAPSFKKPRLNMDLEQHDLNNSTHNKGTDQENIIECLPSQLDSQRDLNCSESLISDSNIQGTDSRDGFLKDTTNDSKSEFSGFLEYWIPVPVSSVQLEQYCAILLSNSSVLCSSAKKDTVGDALHDIIVSTRKCCDHPYIMDSALQPFFMKENKDAASILDVGIKASGKLQMLDVMLSQMRDQDLKVLILFKSSGGSGKGPNIGDILDDFVRQRFGVDSYERIDEGVLASKKRTAMHNFNNQKGRFVFLLETRACHRSIRLSSNTVIIYNSDWSPLNDLRNLQRSTLDSQIERLKVFRLFSSCTLEENVLILAKKGKTLDSNIMNYSSETCHMLLMQGSLDLFRKLDEFHIRTNPAGCESTLCEQKLSGDIINEFLTILPKNILYNSRRNYSLILQAKYKEGSNSSYITNLALPGELKVQDTEAELPHLFWKKLLVGKQPRWKYPSGLSQLKRRRTQQMDDSSQKLAGDEVIKRHKKAKSSKSDRPSQPIQENVLVGDEKETFGAPASHETTNLLKSQKSIHLHLKPQIAKLCDVLKLPENVKSLVEDFFEYIMKNHHVTSDPNGILQAFQISLCWNAASFLKFKLDHKESLALAKKHLEFSCKTEEANFLYSFLRCLRTMFFYDTGKLGVPYSEDASNSTEDLIDDDIDDQFLSQLGLARSDYLKSIKYIKKKFQKQMEKEQQKHHEEKEDMERKFKEEEALLETKRKTDAAVIRLHNSSSSVRADKLKLLDVEYAKEFEKLMNEKKKHLEDLESLFLAARSKLQKKEAHWLECLKNWAKVELIKKPSLDKAEHNHKQLNCSKSNTEEVLPSKSSMVANGEVLNGDKTTPNGDKTTPNGDLQFPESRVNQDNGEFPLVVTGTAPDEPQEGPNIDTSPGTGVGQQERVILLEVSGNNQACEVGNQVSRSNSVNQEDCRSDVRVIATAPSVVEGSNAERNGHTDGIQQDGVGSINNQVSHPQALQDECPVMVTSPGLQDGLASATENHVLLQQLETAVNVAHHVPESQSVRHMDCSNQCRTSNSGSLPTVQVGDRPMHTESRDVSQPVAQNLPMQIPAGGLQTMPYLRPPAPLHLDPLQNELEKIRKEASQITTVYEQTRSKMKSDCEKEIEEATAQIRRRYETKLQEMETAFQVKNKEIDAKHNKVVRNKFLAEAFRSKCVDNKAPAPPSFQKETGSSFSQQLQQLLQADAQRPSVVPSTSTPGIPAGRPLVAASPAAPASTSQNTTPCRRPVPQSSGTLSIPQTRPPLINSISLTPANQQAGSEFRAPAPHLQAYRPTTPASLPHVMPSQQMPSNPVTNSPAGSLLPQRPPLQSGTDSRVQRTQFAGILPSLSTQSALELLRDVHNQSNTNSTSQHSSPSLNDWVSSLEQLIQPNHNNVNRTVAETTCTTAVVCLSDDE